MDPDQTAPYQYGPRSDCPIMEQSDLGRHCLPKRPPKDNYIADENVDSLVMISMNALTWPTKV